jgi:hypothetical protein
VVGCLPWFIIANTRWSRRDLLMPGTQFSAPRPNCEKCVPAIILHFTAENPGPSRSHSLAANQRGQRSRATRKDALLSNCPSSSDLW